MPSSFRPRYFQNPHAHTQLSSSRLLTAAGLFRDACWYLSLFAQTSFKCGWQITNWILWAWKACRCAWFCALVNPTHPIHLHINIFIKTPLSLRCSLSKENSPKISCPEFPLFREGWALNTLLLCQKLKGIHSPSPRLLSNSFCWALRGVGRYQKALRRFSWNFRPSYSFPTSCSS